MKTINKNTVKSIIRHTGVWTGYIAQNNVNSFHITEGWHLGMEVEFRTLEELEKTCKEFHWYNDDSELGHGIRFWER